MESTHGDDELYGGGGTSTPGGAAPRQPLHEQWDGTTAETRGGVASSSRQPPGMRVGGAGGVGGRKSVAWDANVTPVTRVGTAALEPPQQQSARCVRATTTPTFQLLQFSFAATDGDSLFLRRARRDEGPPSPAPHYDGETVDAEPSTRTPSPYAAVAAARRVGAGAGRVSSAHHESNSNNDRSTHASASSAAVSSAAVSSAIASASRPRFAAGVFTAVVGVQPTTRASAEDEEGSGAAQAAAAAAAADADAAAFTVSVDYSAAPRGGRALGDSVVGAGESARDGFDVEALPRALPEHLRIEAAMKLLNIKVGRCTS